MDKSRKDTIVCKIEKDTGSANNIWISLKFSGDEYWYEDKVASEIFPVATDIIKEFSKHKVCMYTKLKKRTEYRSVLGRRKKYICVEDELSEFLSKCNENASGYDSVCGTATQISEIKTLFMKRYVEDEILYIVRENIDIELLNMIGSENGRCKELAVSIFAEQKIQHQGSPDKTIEYYAEKSNDSVMDVMAVDTHEIIWINLNKQYLSVDAFFEIIAPILKRYKNNVIVKKEK
ncbi:MAG: hypothetical protein E7488_08145 [Ruminococcaceae bacterium]|nr:hypothetical protein [Oscillospiraceae bacterium]